LARKSASARAPKARAAGSAPRQADRDRILVVDIGGSKVKLLCTGRTKPRSFSSGSHLTPAVLVEEVQKASRGWKFDCVSIGYPGLVGAAGPQSEPLPLGPGWVGFDFATAFGKPVRIVNDAVMQALGSYEGGRMLFIGLGTGLGSTLIIDEVVVPLELGVLPASRKRALAELLGDDGRRRIGNRRWRREVSRVVGQLSTAFNVEYVVLGGGNAKRLRAVPANARLGNNLGAFRGGLRIWSGTDVRTQPGEPACEGWHQFTILGTDRREAPTITNRRAVSHRPRRGTSTDKDRGSRTTGKSVTGA
jgi:polyphosphate glucokinase